MPELTTMEKPKTAGFVDRGYNHARKQKRMEEEEAEIARLEAEARGEEVVEDKPDSESTNEPEVQATDSAEQEETKEETETQEDDSGLDAEEKSFKKRYGDLRRHMQEKEKEWNERIQALESRKASDTIIPPKTPEEINEWIKEYPDVAGIFNKIAEEKAKELFSKAESRLKELDDAHSEALRLKAENVIRKSHDDFDELKAADEFHNWAEEQPKWVQDALYENADDPASVVRVIDLYKIDHKITKADKKANKKAAASVVTKRSKTSVDADDAESYVKESDVAKMSSKEFEKNQDKINEALRSNKFIYDISGSAR